MALQPPSFNPFKRAKKATNKNGLLTRLKDTYDVLVGSPNADDDNEFYREDLESKFYSSEDDAHEREKAHIGLFDILSVFSLALIEAGIKRLLAYTNREKNNATLLQNHSFNFGNEEAPPQPKHKENFKTFLAGVGIFLLGIPYLPLKLLSVVFGLVGTAITLPITLILVHPIAKLVQWRRNANVQTSDHSTREVSVSLVQLHNNDNKDNVNFDNDNNDNKDNVNLPSNNSNMTTFVVPSNEPLLVDPSETDHANQTSFIN